MKKYSLFLLAAALVLTGGQPGFAKKKVPIGLISGEVPLAHHASRVIIMF